MNLTFYRYGGHIEFIRFTEYYEDAQGPALTQYLCALFAKKRELQCIFLGKKVIIYTAQQFFFSIYNLFLRKLEEKLAPKARINTDASISDIAHAPWASHNTPYNPIN